MNPNVRNGRAEEHGAAEGGAAGEHAQRPLFPGVTSFVAARAFATLNPSAVVSGGIHFRHFWYGLILVIAAGFAGIIYGLPAYKRIYIVVFGLGTGLVGDEVGSCSPSETTTRA